MNEDHDTASSCTLAAAAAESSLSRLDLARRLVAQLERGDEDGAIATIHRLGAPFERALFEELGKLTRELHEALKSTRDDSRLAELTRDEIPDAKQRLNYVITMTEQATHRTLNAVDQGLPVAEALHEKTRALLEDWQRFRRREMTLEGFRQFANELDEFFAAAETQTERLRALMSDIMMAQDFQDLTGQIIGRVIRTVQKVEDSLVELLRLSSSRMETFKPAVVAETTTRGQGPAVPQTKDTLAQVVTSQDEVDDLLSSLGF